MKIAPDFFLVGAPKCGTSSMAEWLSSHPAICFSQPKEPYYYFTEYKNRRRFTERDVYLSTCFAHCGASQHLWGEGSVWYMYSEEAIKNILRDNNSAKFIVMLRKPIDMAYSLYQFNRYKGYEDCLDFDQAWDKQAERQRGHKIPNACPVSIYLQYELAAKFSVHLRRLYDLVDRGNVKVVILDDVKNDPKSEYVGILNFLGVDQAINTDFKIINEAVTIKHPNLRTWINKIYGIKPKYLGSLGLMGALNRLVVEKRVTTKQDAITKDKYASLFCEEVLELERLLGRDLSFWK